LEQAQKFNSFLQPVAPAPRTNINAPERKLEQQLPPIKKRKKKRKKGRISKGKEERKRRKSPKECEGSGWLGYRSLHF
jgi:hypothetical protein